MQALGENHYSKDNKNEERIISPRAGELFAHDERYIKLLRKEKNVNPKTQHYITNRHKSFI